MRVSTLFFKKRLMLIIFCFVYIFPKTEIFFSPNGNISEKLISKIDNAKNKIYAAIYFITAKKISEALIRAKTERGVDVQVITDQSCLESKYGKIDILKSEGIDLFIYKSNLKDRKYSSSIMHNKFAIIDDAVWTGSFNWTRKANKKNHENVILIDDKDVYLSYIKEFRSLKNRCITKNVNNFTGNYKKNRLVESKTRKFKKKLLAFFKRMRKIHK